LYLGIHEGLLRYFTPEVNLVTTPEETAELEIKRAEREAQISEQETQREERLAAELRKLNINPGTI
jgi:hypothetical protein